MEAEILEAKKNKPINEEEEEIPKEAEVEKPKHIINRKYTILYLYNIYIYVAPTISPEPVIKPIRKFIDVNYQTFFGTFPSQPKSG